MRGAQKATKCSFYWHHSLKLVEYSLDIMHKVLHEHNLKHVIDFKINFKKRKSVADLNVSVIWSCACLI